MKPSSRTITLLLLILLLGAFVRLYHLDGIPAEMWGDVSLGAAFTDEILSGRWPWYFVLGNGPLFFYIAAGITWWWGLSFFTMKVTSVMVGVALISASYLFGSTLAGKKIGLLTAWFFAISRWPITYSREGIMNILVPFFVALIYYFLVRAIKKNKPLDWILMAITLGIGLYNYPVFAMIMPPTVGCTLLVFLVKNRSRFWEFYKALLVACVIIFILSIPLIRMLFGQPDYWFSSSSYFGSKLITQGGGIRHDWPIQLLINIKNSFGMFHIRGDEIFRGNIPHQPHLDIISGILLLIGLIGVLRGRLRFAYVAIIPFIMLQIPQILVLNFPRETPNTARSIALLPFVYLLTALGLYWVYRFFCKMRSQQVATIFCTIIAVTIVIINFYQYFLIYPRTLPNANTPYGKIIAQTIEALDWPKAVYLIGCCWGEWGQPEPQSLYYSFIHHDQVFNYNQIVTACIDITVRPAIVIFSPHDTRRITQFQGCFPDAHLSVITRNNQQVATFMEVL